MNLMHFKIEDPLFQDFLGLPKKLYEPGSVRLLQKENINHHLVQQCYLVEKDDWFIARAALYKNPDLVYNNLSTACVGNYECIKDPAASKLLLEAIFDDARQYGAEYILGPMNGSTWDDYRFSRNHAIPPFFMEPHHHLYYNDQFTNAGFESIADYISSSADCSNFTERGSEGAERLASGELLMRPVQLDAFEEELEKLYHFCKVAFASNYFYTPIDAESFKEKYRQAKAIIKPEFFQICTTRTGEIVGFMFCADDLYHPQEKILIIKTVARNPDPAYTGLGTLLANKVYGIAAEKGYQKIIHAFMHLKNASVVLSGKFAGTASNNYSLYGKSLK